MVNRPKTSTGLNSWDQLELLKSSTDAFGKLIADGTSNRADLPAHHPMSPQRHRLYQDGARVSPHYGEGTDIFTDELDCYKLTPSGGETLKFQSAERFRYVVQYEGLWSQALALNQELQGDDELRLLYEGDVDDLDNATTTEGHGLIFTSEGARAVHIREGVEVESKHIDPPRPLTEFTRFECRYNWYNVGNNIYRQTFTDDGEQINADLGKTSVEPGRGERVGNGRITVEVETDPTTTGLEVEVGSSGYIILGDVDPIERIKAASVDNITHSGSGEFEPLMALRLQDGKGQIATNISGLQILDSPADAIVTVVATDPALTDAANFNPAPEFDDDSTAIEGTLDVSTMPDANGVEVTSTPNPGGYQIGYAAAEDLGGNRGTASTEGTRSETIHDTDVALVLGMSPAAGDFHIEYTTSQQW